MRVKLALGILVALVAVAVCVAGVWYQRLQVKIYNSRAIVAVLDANRDAAADCTRGSSFNGKKFSKEVSQIDYSKCPAAFQKAWMAYVDAVDRDYRWGFHRQEPASTALTRCRAIALDYGVSFHPIVPGSTDR